VVKNTLARGHRAGVLAALGAAVANTLQATLAGLGLWGLVGRWPLVLDALRIGGAGYLAWLGLQAAVRAWPGHAPRPRGSILDTSAPAGPPLAQSSRPGFVEGLTINLLNPAIISFYMAVVPTFMPPSPPRNYFLLLAATHVGLAFVCHAAWATAFHVLRRIVARPGVRVALELGTAAALLWLAARVLGRL
jgi:threonine/homoserine/homoserine lactone efflux protein